MPSRGRFDGFHAVHASVSKTCLVRFDNNKYSVQASAVGRTVEVRAYADRIELRQDGRVVGAHARAFGRTAGDDHDPRSAAADLCADRRLQPLRQPQEGNLMERSQILEAMGELKL